MIELPKKILVDLPKPDITPKEATEQKESAEKVKQEALEPKKDVVAS